MTAHKDISFETDTKQINDDVKAKIANHLWMFCGYNDSMYPAINFDARLIKAILDLYNMVIDSSLITRLKCIAQRKWGYIVNIDKIRETINMLRTIGAHTVSQENGRQDILQEYRLWEVENCGTENPTKDCEFEKLIDNLVKLEEECVNIVTQFINDASGLNGTDKEELICKWEDQIIKHYCKPANNNMFKNRVINRYIICQLSGSLTVASNKTVLWRVVSDWIMKEIYLKDQEHLDLLIEIKRKYYPKLETGQRELLDQRIQVKRDSISEIQKEVATFVGKEVEELTPVDYKEHYLSKDVLEKKMRDAIPEIKNQGLTLLPPDLFSYILEKDLKREP